jgi:hypothetical protein
MNKNRISHTELMRVIHPQHNNLIQQWISKGVIYIQDKKPGRGKIRQYTWPEAIFIWSMVSLLNNGRNHKLNAKIAKIVADRAAEGSLRQWIDYWKEKHQTDTCMLAYQIFKNEEIEDVARYKFIPIKEFHMDTLIFDGFWTVGTEVSFIYVDELIARFGEEIIYQNQ